MTNVISYLIELSNEQKHMFEEMSKKVSDIEDHIDLILFRIQELSNKFNKE
jgi:hypothetical protein